MQCMHGLGTAPVAQIRPAHDERTTAHPLVACVVAGVDSLFCWCGQPLTVSTGYSAEQRQRLCSNLSQSLYQCISGRNVALWYQTSVLVFVALVSPLQPKSTHFTQPACELYIPTVTVAHQGGVGVPLLRCFWSGCWAPPGVRALGVSYWWRQCRRPPTIRFASLLCMASQ
jgi:hypothetical protein